MAAGLGGSPRGVPHVPSKDWKETSVVGKVKFNVPQATRAACMWTPG